MYLVTPSSKVLEATLANVWFDGWGALQNIAIWHERLGRSADEIATEYDLTLADVYAALAYYFDHREEIDRSIEESNAFVEALRKQTPSKLQQKLRAQGLRGDD